MFEILGRMYNDQELFDLDVKATSVWNTLKDSEKEVVRFVIQIRFY